MRLIKHRALLPLVALCYIILLMSRSHPQVNFRIPSELKEQLEQAAKKNHRTITAELVTRLETSFTYQGPAISSDKHAESANGTQADENIAIKLEELKKMIKELINNQ